MPKYSKPLAQNPFHQWGARIGGAAGVDPSDLADKLTEKVIIAMTDNYGIDVNANKTDVTVGGLFNRTTFPGVSFSFTGHADWAGYLVGFNKKAAIISVDIVQVGAPSKAVQRMNEAESKDQYSVGGILHRAIAGAVVNQDAVETERMYYDTLLQVITEVINDWMK